MTDEFWNFWGHSVDSGKPEQQRHFIRASSNERPTKQGRFDSNAVAKFYAYSAVDEPPADPEMAGVADEPSGVAVEHSDDADHVAEETGASDVDAGDVDVNDGIDDLSSAPDGDKRQHHRR